MEKTQHNEYANLGKSAQQQTTDRHFRWEKCNPTNVNDHRLLNISNHLRAYQGLKNNVSEYTLKTMTVNSVIQSSDQMT